LYNIWRYWWNSRHPTFSIDEMKKIMYSFENRKTAWIKRDFFLALFPVFLTTRAFTRCQTQNILAHNIFWCAVWNCFFFLSQQLITFVRKNFCNWAGWRVHCAVTKWTCAHMNFDQLERNFTAMPHKWHQIKTNRLPWGEHYRWPS
jgi:hypothetical protein